MQHRIVLYLFILGIILGCQKTTGIAPSSTVFVELLFDFPAEIRESSGLVLHENKLLTINDSGDTPHLYQLEQTGLLLQKHFIQNTINRDWEALSYNDDALFIGDFGNNWGNRQDLTIYKVAIDSFSLQDSFRFLYSNQFQYEFEYETHNFNMEAMVATEEELFLFSKNHINKKTYLYKLALQNTENTIQSISPIDSFNVNGLITGAAYMPATQKLALVGYDDTALQNVFIWCFSDFRTGNYFKNAQYWALDIQEQVEGICFFDAQTLLIASEKESINGGRVYRIRWME